jgi:hypothetical protein
MKGFGRGRAVRNRPFLEGSRRVKASAATPRSLVALALAVSVVSIPFPASATSRLPGDELWVRRYHGTANGDDGAISVATDGTRVYVTGSSYGSGTLADYTTVAYGAVTGDKLWVRRYNGPGNSYDVARSVATDGTGVYVTGKSNGSGTRFRLRHGGLRCDDRGQAVGSPIQRACERSRHRLLRGHRWDRGVRDRVQQWNKHVRRLRHRGLRGLILGHSRVVTDRPALPEDRANILECPYR